MMAVGRASSDYSHLFSPHVLAAVNPETTYPRIKEMPFSCQGKTLIIGDEILAAKRLRDHTRLTILQLPLGLYKGQRPIVPKRKVGVWRFKKNASVQLLSRLDLVSRSLAR